MAFKTNLLHHLRRINSCLPYFDAKAELDVETFRLKIWARNKYFRLLPQYFIRQNGRILYSSGLSPDVRGFIGWLPQLNPRWDLATDKISFKEYCTHHDIRTPEYWRSSTDAPSDVLTKERVSSFGSGIRGPFKSLPDEIRSKPEKDNIFYERFIVGKIAKAWYWENKLVCLEISAMPTITGNGQNTTRELVTARVPAGNLEPDWTAVTDMVVYQGVQLDEIPEKGKTIVADFKYGSMLLPRRQDNSNAIGEHRETEVGQQFAHAGRLLWQGIPEEIRPMRITAADAIIDEKNRVWFLEVNSNPIVHPDAYFSILESLFGRPNAEVKSVNPLPAALLTPSP